MELGFLGSSLHCAGCSPTMAGSPLWSPVMLRCQDNDPVWGVFSLPSEMKGLFFLLSFSPVVLTMLGIKFRLVANTRKLFQLLIVITRLLINK
jgi:hypothetical protein